MSKHKKIGNILILLFFITVAEACYAKIIDKNSYTRIKRIEYLEIKKPINAQATLIISDLGKDDRGNKIYHFGYACTTCKNLKITRINLYDEKQYPIASQQSNENKGDIVMPNSWVGWLSPSIPQYYDIEFDQSNNNISKGTMPELEASLKTSPNPGEGVELTLTNISSKDITITKITLPATNAIENNDLPGLAPEKIRHGESIKFELKPEATDNTNIYDLSDKKFVIGFEYTVNNESNSVYTGGIYIAYSYDWPLEKAKSEGWGTKEKIGAVVGGTIVGGIVVAGVVKGIQAYEEDDGGRGRVFSRDSISGWPGGKSVLGSVLTQEQLSEIGGNVLAIARHKPVLSPSISTASTASTLAIPAVKVLGKQPTNSSLETANPLPALTQESIATTPSTENATLLQANPISQRELSSTSTKTATISSQSTSSVARSPSTSPRERASDKSSGTSSQPVSSLARSPSTSARGRVSDKPATTSSQPVSLVARLPSTSPRERASDKSSTISSPPVSSLARSPSTSARGKVSDKSSTTSSPPVSSLARSPSTSARGRASDKSSTTSTTTSSSRVSSKSRHSSSITPRSPQMSPRGNSKTPSDKGEKK